MRKPSLLAFPVLATCALLLTACMTPEEQAAVNAINHDRAVHGVGPAGTNLALTLKAQSWAKHLLAHSGGKCSSATLVHSNLADGAPQNWKMLGENVGCRISGGTVADAVAPMEAAFMASPGHRANILNARFNYAGTGFASMPAANGMILVYEVQEFATL